MNTFLVLYLAPVSTLKEWAKTDAKQREKAEVKMREEWQEWMVSHKEALRATAGVGRTKRVGLSGVADVKNGIMLYSIVEASSHEKVAEMFKDHPHLEIPGATIEIMPANPLPS